MNKAKKKIWMTVFGFAWLMLAVILFFVVLVMYSSGGSSDIFGVWKSIMFVVVFVCMLLAFAKGTKLISTGEW